jgi:hypothetical protein
MQLDPDVSSLTPINSGTLTLMWKWTVTSFMVELAYFMHHIDARGPKKEDVCDCRQSGTQDNIYLAHNLLFRYISLFCYRNSTVVSYSNFGEGFP